MIRKILSDGQTAAGRAGLDAAIKLGIAHGGDDLREPSTPEEPAADAPPRDGAACFGLTAALKRNVLDADGTLILSQGAFVEEASPIRRFAETSGLPSLYVDLDRVPAFSAAMTIAKWIETHRIEILHITGPQRVEAPKIYQNALHILESVFYLEIMGEKAPHSPAPSPMPGTYPRTVDEAIAILIAEMPLKDKVTLANMAETELPALDSTLGTFIRRRFGLWSGNQTLIESCRFVAGKKDVTPHDVPSIIIAVLWKKLKETHKLRVIED